MIEDGKGKELMPRDAWEVPITADRYMSLAGTYHVANANSSESALLL